MYHAYKYIYDYKVNNYYYNHLLCPALGKESTTKCTCTKRSLEKELETYHDGGIA